MNEIDTIINNLLRTKRQARQFSSNAVVIPRGEVVRAIKRIQKHYEMIIKNERATAITMQEE